MIAILLFAAWSGQARASGLATGFLDFHSVAPGAALQIRYAGPDNFIGSRVDGYFAPRCLLSTRAARALSRVERKLERSGKRLRIYDCYRPARAVAHFVRWARDLQDLKTKARYYPTVKKEDLFRDGYIAEKSGHSRGSTVDLAIDGLDFGSPFDFFDPVSHTDSTAVSERAQKNRMRLKTLMEEAGFKNLPEEWWHYTLKEEPHPDTYFDFPVEPVHSSSP